jgi:hypothetical protein
MSDQKFNSNWINLKQGIVDVHVISISGLYADLNAGTGLRLEILRRSKERNCSKTGRTCSNRMDCSV